MPDHSTNTQTAERWRNLLLLLPFLVLLVIQLTHHEMWKDELNAFGIAASSPTIPSLFDHVHYEGHPWLWYGLLWLVAKVTPSPIGMKVLEGIIGAGILLMISNVSPFSRWEKVMLLLSYFFTFEYTVMSRMYGLMVLLLMLYLRDRVQNPQGLLGKAMLLGLLCNTDLMGWILCAGLSTELLLSWFGSNEANPRPPMRTILQGVALYLVLAAFAFWSMRPYDTVSTRTTGHPLEHWNDLRNLAAMLVRYIAGPYSPIRWGWNQAFWNYVFRPQPYAYAFVPMVLAAYWLTFRHRWNLLANVAVTIVCAVAFGHLIYGGSVRHFGVTFLAFFASVWILRAQEHRLPIMAYVLIGFTTIAGVWTNVLEWRRPFSNAENTTQWLRAQRLDQMPIAGTPDISLANIAELLQRPVYFLDCRCSDTFLLYSKRRDNFSPSDIPQRLATAGEALHTKDLLYIGITPLTESETIKLQDLGVHVRLLQSFLGAVAIDEDYYIYRATSK
jgi:hypothetical protein